MRGRPVDQLLERVGDGQRDDRDVDGRGFGSLAGHLSAANYCWFEDPAKALCLRLAGTRAAAAPLTGLCDSSRCPQATHHIVHRSVCQTTADNSVVLPASPRIPPAEKTRLRAEHDRSVRVLEEIDKAVGKVR